MSRARAKAGRGQPDTRFARFLIVLGGVILALGLWGAVNGALTLRWPRAAATVVDASLVLHEAQRTNARIPDAWHTFNVHYACSVDGRNYLGGHVEPYDFGMQNSTGAVKMNERHPIGSTAQVAYDPAEPGVAYLEPGPSSFSLALTGIGAAVGLVGLWMRGLILRGVGAGDDDEAEPAKGPA
jgi:hypothetical protein